MTFVVKCKLQDVEKAISTVPPGHRLVAAFQHSGYDPVELAAWRRGDLPDLGDGKPHLPRPPELHEWRDLYFEREPAADIDSPWQFDSNGVLLVRVVEMP